jgi:hypothetical protein
VHQARPVALVQHVEALCNRRRRATQRHKTQTNRRLPAHFCGS